MRHKTVHIIAGLLIPLCLLNMAVATDGMVLCVAECGHVAIEMAHDVWAIACQDPHTHPEPATNSDCSHDCTDVLLGRAAIGSSGTNEMRDMFLGAASPIGDIMPLGDCGFGIQIGESLWYSSQPIMSVLRI